MNIRRLDKVNNLTFYNNEFVLIIDNGCDQTIINLNSFLISTFTGVTFIVHGAMASMDSSPVDLVNDAYTLATLDNGYKCIFKIN